MATLLTAIITGIKGLSMSKSAETPKVDPVAEAAAAVEACRKQRAEAHSLELRQVLALEQIADELTALRTTVVKPVA
jgi:hypothetical protein